MNTAAIVTPSVLSAASRIATATSVAWVTSGGTKMARIASHASASTSVWIVRL